jgi:serine/threonine protein kinase
MAEVSRDHRDTTLETGDDDEHVTEEEAIEVGGRHGPYALERRIGVGGMGEVFAARHVETGQIVALKTLSRAQPTQRYRFKREFRSIADVEHPNLVRLFELYVPDKGVPFYTMELLDAEPFTSYVRGELDAGELPEIPRLEAALLQLVEGLDCLHAHGYVHRDLKPSNVLVTREGRVVILDFGIIAEHNEIDRGVTRDGQVLGTPAYMAPEQASGDRAESPADIYALGIILYESLTGEPAFVGNALMMLSEKQEGPTPDPSTVNDAIPKPLRDLCMRMMHRDPARRPMTREILTLLGAQPSMRRRSSPFVGRQRELVLLRRAFSEVREQGRALTMQIRGRSGQGKSALVREFLAELQRNDQVLILRGRCRQRETVPYKGVDALVDALAAHLRQLDEPAREALRPRYVVALGQVFPVLDELWDPGEHERWGHDPHEARSLGWASLRELLGHLAATHPLVLAIDDFQWADRDSSALLRALCRGTDSPVMLVLISARDEVGDAELLAWLDEDDDAAAPELHRIDVGPLPEAEARELALSLLREQASPSVPSEPGPLRSRAEALVLRSAGSPFYIGQMVLGDETMGTIEDLDQIVRRRLIRLEPLERELFEVVAVAGGPILQALALALSPGSAVEHVVGLCKAGLLVRSEGIEDATIEVAHDRFRELILAELEPEVTRGLHWSLGELLLERSLDPGSDDIFAIADHFEAALDDLAELPLARRLELARLQKLAGERALSAGAWISARRYFALGHRLVEPWLDAARTGGTTLALPAASAPEPTPLAGGALPRASEVPRELCLQLASGRVQAEAMVGSRDADAAFTELIGWKLSNGELGRILVQRVAILRRTDRYEEAVELGRSGLARLGWRLPRAPSTLRALVAVTLGLLTLGRRDIAGLEALPDIREEATRIRLDVLGEMAISSFLSQPIASLMFSGVMARAIDRHGRHDAIVSMLVQLAVMRSTLGNAREGSELCERALEYGRRNMLDPIDVLRARSLALMVLPTTRSIPALAAEIEELHRACCDAQLKEPAGFVAVLGSSLYVMTDMPLAEVLATLERFEARDPSHGGGFSHRLSLLLRRYVHALMDGAKLWEPEPTDNRMSFYADLSYRRSVAIMAGDYETARKVADEFPPDYERAMMGSIAIPNHAMFSAMLEAERWPLPSGLERWRSRRRLRRHLATLERWAKQGPETFGPILDLVRGELETTRGRYEEAMAAFERARSKAGETGALWVVGLACTRLARLAKRRGHTLTADSAFAAALDTYERWGALGIAAALRERGP